VYRVPATCSFIPELTRAFHLRNCLFILLLILSLRVLAQPAPGQDTSRLVIRKTTDFTITGDGSSPQWNNAAWVTLPVQETPMNQAPLTRIKALYSDKGLYFLFDCADEKLNTTFDKDFEPLFRQDAIEAFLWPDTSQVMYFEYELSALNYEWPLLVPHISGRSSGWAPMRYEGEKKIQHATSAQGGEKKSMAKVTGWRGEFFIPYRVLHPLVGKPPTPGTQWRGNFYRLDYDHGYTTWTWKKTGPSFHNYSKFGTLVFQ
jgi:hypothetical protein